ncbi:Ig-like domain-containing protein, partial [Mongoliitalea lutea]
EITADEDDPTPGNDSSTVTPEPLRADISIEKSQIASDNLPLPNVSSSASSLITVSPSEIVAGTKIYYYLRVINNGPNNSIDALISDNLPAGISNPEFSLNFGNSWDPWNGERLLSNFLVSPGVNNILIRGDVDADLTATTLVNTATINSSVTFDDDLSNNESSVTTTVVQSADLSITKEELISPVLIGGVIDYRIIVSNDGPSTARNVIITDAIDNAIISDQEYSIDNGATWISPWTGSLNVGNLADQASFTLRIRGIVVDAAPDPNVDPIPNTASVTSDAVDPNPLNNTVTIETALGVEADLSIVKDGPAEVTAGESVLYTITVTNNSGTFNASTVSIVDNISSSIANPEFTVTPGDESSWQPWTGSLSIGTLAANSTFELSIRGVVRSNVTIAALGNTATVTSGTPDGDLSNNTSTVSSAVLRIADVGVRKEVLPSSNLVAGGEVRYLITYFNNGPSDAFDVTVTDIVPSSLINVTASRCLSNFVAWTGSLNIGTVVAGGECTVEIRATVAPGFTGLIDNTASVVSNQDDPDTANNSSTVTVEIPPIISVGDVTVTEGDIAVFDIQLSTPSINTIDIIPQLISGTAVIGVDTAPPYEYSIDGGVTWIEWIGGPISIPAGITSVLFRVPTVDDDIDEDDETFTFTVSSSDTSNPSASATGTILDNDVPALSITKTQIDGPNPVTAAGQVLTYQIVVENTGSAILTNIDVTDQFPGAGQGTLGLPVKSINTDNILDLGETWTYPATYTVTQVDIDANLDLVNTARVTTIEIPGPIEGIALTEVTQTPGIAVVKTARIGGTGAGLEGEVITYTFTVTNTGNVTLSNVAVTDPLTGISAITLSSGTTTLAPTETAVFTATYTITLADINAGSITNQATATGTDPNGVDTTDLSGTAVDNDDVTFIDLSKAPVANDDFSLANQPGPVTLNVTANDTDANNDLDVSTVQFVGTDNPGDALVVTGQGVWSVDVFGNVTFTPELGFTNDPTPISYVVSDATGLVSNVARITIDYAPVATSDESLGNAVGQPVTVAVLANDITGDLVVPATVQLAGTAAAGAPLTVAGEGEWTVNTATGAITFTPEVGFTGNPAAV